MTLPESRREDRIETLHGVEVADPYRWLEDDVRESDEVAAWVKAQNAVTDAWLEQIPERAAIRDRLRELWDYERFSAPVKVAGRRWFMKNDGLQDQPVLMAEDAESAPRVVLDPNGWSDDGTVALSSWEPSPCGRRLAYSIAEAGSDWHKWKILDLETGEELPEVLDWIKFGGVAWTRDGKGFFYSRYDKPKKGAQFQSLNFNQRLYYHRLHEPQKEDVLVYARPDHPDWGFSPAVTDDGRRLVITIWKGTDPRYRVVTKDLEEPYEMALDLIDDFDSDFSFVGNDGPLLYFRTDHRAKRGRLIAIDLRKPEREHWRELIAERRNTLRAVSLVGNTFVCHYLEDARSEVRLHRLDGSLIRKVELPGIGTADGFLGSRTDSETFYSFSGFTAPAAIYRLDLISGASEAIYEASVAFRPDDFVVEQVFYESRDGTRVPMFLIFKKGLVRDGQNPVLLYGYGGFNIPLTPNFSAARIAWLELGGIYAIANLRGGGEYGEDWHRAGTKLQKQNVFDDFCAAARWLITREYTSAEKLGIMGGSNGGLLVGACMTQQPELFGACLPAVGVMDMLRFHKFTAGRFWVDDYGSPDNPREFKALHAYSPYHNLREGTDYPATLVTTADTDDRVVPGHSFKFIAALQHAAGEGRGPQLIRIETRAGHGAGKPTGKQIEEVADKWAFLVRALEIQSDAPWLTAESGSEG